MDNTDYITGTAIKANQRKIDAYLAILDTGTFDNAQLELIYTVLGNDYNAYVAGLITDLNTKKTALDADFAAL